MIAKAVGFMLLAIMAAGLLRPADAQGASVTYVYDNLGRLEYVSSSDGYTRREIDYAYDDVGNLISRTAAQSKISTVDADGDQMPDGWEVQHGLNPQDPSDAALDSDQDGLSNLEEFYNGTDPRQADTDGDGYASGGIAYTYDNLGLLEYVSSSYGHTRRTINYVYDDVGNLVSRSVTVSRSD